MPSRFNVGFRMQSTEIHQRGSRSFGTRLLAGAALFAGLIFLLVYNFGFARYAVTGIFWVRTTGTVLSPRRTSVPSIRFVTPDGADHLFKEDYILLCGRRSLCYMRDFDPGEIVPVVYDPHGPQRAYVYDWALFANVITWFFTLGIGFLLAVMVAALVRRRPVKVSVQWAGNVDPD